MKWKWLWVACGVVAVLLAGAVVWLKSTGLSAQPDPPRWERALTRQARAVAIPSAARGAANPFSTLNDTDLAHAREHWVAHCSTCHGLDGKGDTTFGRNMYPRTPDMTRPETQRLTDGEMFYVISNGVRFTGMPAFGQEDSRDDIWHLVTFIRRLPHLSSEEKQLLEKLAQPEVPGKGEAEGHTHAPGTPPHKH